MGTEWGYAMMHDLNELGGLEDLTTVYFPKYFPIPFGYYWGKFPVLYEENGN